MIHEVVSSPGMLTYAAKGAQSIVFRVELPSESRPLAVKTLRYRQGGGANGFTDINYRKRRQDALVLERLTSSPYVASIYGFCAMGVVAPFAPTDLRALVNSERLGGQWVPPMGKLRIGVQVAEGLAALHGIDGPASGPSIAHGDLHLGQHVYEDGIFRLNDFGSGKMLRHSPGRDGVPCQDTQPMRGHCGAAKYQAPEELEGYFVNGGRYSDSCEATTGRPDVADVFSLGTELYMILTNRGMWVGEDFVKSLRRLMRGERPPVPKNLSKSPDGAIGALLHALEMCWEQDPEARATSRDVAMFLREELGRLEGGGVQGRGVKVELPPVVDGPSFLDDD